MGLLVFYGFIVVVEIVVTKYVEGRVLKVAANMCPDHGREMVRANLGRDVFGGCGVISISHLKSQNPF